VAEDHRCSYFQKVFRAVVPGTQGQQAAPSIRWMAYAPGSSQRSIGNRKTAAPGSLSPSGSCGTLDTLSFDETGIFPAYSAAVPDTRQVLVL